MAINKQNSSNTELTENVEVVSISEPANKTDDVKAGKTVSEKKRMIPLSFKLGLFLVVVITVVSVVLINIHYQAYRKVTYDQIYRNLDYIDMTNFTIICHLLISYTVPLFLHRL